MNRNIKINKDQFFTIYFNKYGNHIWDKQIKKYIRNH